MEDYVVVARGSQPPGGVEEFPVLRCRRHGVEFADALARSSPIDAMQDSLDELYGAPTESSARYIDFMNHVEAVVGRPPNAVLHDVGCGNGQLMLEARRRGWHTQGNDILASVKPRIEQYGIPCWIGTLRELDLTPESCDVITSFCVLPHHLTDPTPEMRAAWRMLKPRSWLVLQLPANGTYRRLGKLIYRCYWPGRPTKFSRYVIANLYGPGGHQFAYTPQNLATYLGKCGFDRVRVAAYFSNSRYTLARFATRPWWFRVAAWSAVSFGNIAGRILQLPNHMIAYARKAATPPPDMFDTDS